MLDKIGKLEEKINKVLGKVIQMTKALCLKLFLAIIPNIVINAYKSSKQKSLTSVNQSFSGFKTLFISFNRKVSTKKENFFNHIDKIQQYPVKEKGREKFQNLKVLLLESSPKVHLTNLKIWLKEKIKWIYTKLNFTKSYHFKLGVCLSFFSAIGLYTIYFGSSSIFESEYPSRSIASAQEYDYRPEYKYYQDKTLQILNVKVPIYVEKQGSIDSITIDFSLRLSTKFSKYFLQEYEYKLKDYFFTAVEPVESDFPIHEEGKEVLKEAIQDEINNFLIDNNVEGEVLEVNILYLVGS
jgi:flagellar basal body-associated protein FliL